MLGLLSRLLGQMAFTGCCLAANMLVVSLALLARQTPAALGHLRRALRGGLLLSFRLYAALLRWLGALLGTNLSVGWPRLAACLVLSSLPGALLIIFGVLPLSLLVLAPFILHGLVVGWLWDELAEPGGLRLGERL